MINTREIATEYRLSHWSEVMRRRIESKLSIKAFCEEEGIHQNVYHYWQRKLRETAVTEFLPMKQSETVEARSKWLELEITKDSEKAEESRSIMVEIDGCRISVDSETDIELLVKICKELKKC